MKEQIEEMAVDLCLIDTCKHLPQEECNKTTCAHCEAEALYNAGYRKQSEGEWIINGTDGNLVGNWRCSACNSVSLKDGNYCPNCGAHMKGGAE